MQAYDRRTLLRLGGVAAAAAVAGCSGSGDSGGENPTDTETATETTAEPTTTSGGNGGAPPGADVLGGPDDLRSSATLEAVQLDTDQGAGTFVFTPAVVFLEPGGTVTWEIEGAHSVTAYHPDNGDVPQRVPDGTAAYDSGTLASGDTFERTFETTGVHNYYCTPHKGLGMTGVVVVGEAAGGPGTTEPTAERLSEAERNHLTTQLVNAGLAEAGGDQESGAYAWQDATWDSYWYSLYNMSTNIAMSGNGVRFPHNEQQRKAANERVPAMLSAADVDKPPIKNPYLNMAPFTTGVPEFTEKPVFDAGDGRPDGSTLRWDKSKSSGVVSPSSVGWTHLKGVTWAKNFQNHFEKLPPSTAAKFRAQLLTTLAQIGTNAALIAGGPEGNGALTKGDSLELVSGFRPADGTVVDSRTRLRHHSAMLWFLSDLTSLAQGGWFGYVNPEPLIPAKKIQQLADGLAKTTMNAFPAADVVADTNTRMAGEFLATLGWYGTHAGSEEAGTAAANYADALAGAVAREVDGNGRVAKGVENQAATQGIVGQGLAWASQIDGVDHAGTAESVLGFMRDELWDADAKTYATGTDDVVYRISARDAGDITGGVNAADAALSVAGMKEQYAAFFDTVFNEGRLQRAQRPPSRDGETEHSLPLPPKAGGEFGQAAVYNAEVTRDDGGEWSVTDSTFDCEQALYLANQEIWISHWGGQFFQGRGVPGESDEPA